MNIEKVLLVLQEELKEQDSLLLKDIKISGNNAMINCPFHSDGLEKKPSCGVLLADNTNYGDRVPAGTFHCFTCGERGELNYLVSKLLGYNDIGLIGEKWLRNRFNYTHENYRREEFDGLFEHQKEAIKCMITEEELKKFDYYHQYMYDRGLTDKVIDFFRIGYDREHKAVTFPIRNLDGIVVGMQKRYTQFKGFFNEGLTGKVIYGLYETLKVDYQNRDVYITESPLDALTAWVNKNCGIALLGMPSNEQLQILKESSIRSFIIATDNDKAGIKAKYYLKRMLSNKILYHFNYPKGKKDLNDFNPEEFLQIEKKLL